MAIQEMHPLKTGQHEATANTGITPRPVRSGQAPGQTMASGASDDGGTQEARWANGM